MNKIALIAGLAVAASANADVLLNVDLSVVDQITITATGGVSSADASTSNFTGVLLDGIFGETAALTSSLVSGDLVSANQSSDMTPAIFRAGGGTDAGLNIWTIVDGGGSITFTNGSAAFSGSATWNIATFAYTSLLNGATSGAIYSGADDTGDIAGGAISIGTYRVVPTPSSAALLGLGGLMVARRRR